MKRINVKIIFVVLLFIVAFVAVLLISFLARREPSAPSGQPFPSISPTGAIEGISSVTRVFPEENTNEAYLPIQQIEIQFSQPVSASNITVSSASSVFIKVGQVNPNTIILSPDPFWNPGDTTTITLSRFATDGKQIFENDYTYRIYTDHPEIPEFIE